MLNLVFLISILVSEIYSSVDYKVFPVKLNPFIVVPKILELPNHAYMIKGLDGSYVMVDCGQASDYDTIRNLFIERDIKYIIISHAHPDHLGCLQLLKNEFKNNDWKFISHRLEAEDVRIGRLAASKPYGFLPNLLMGPLFWLTDHIFGDSIITDASVAVQPDILFSEDDFDESIKEDLLNIYGVEIIHTVGHTRGSLSVFVHNSGEVIIGDMLSIQAFSSDFGYHTLVIDEDELINSFQKIFSMNPTKIYAPHLPSDTRVDEVIKNLGLENRIKTEFDEM